MRAEQVEEGRSPRPICLVSGRCGAVGALGRRRLLLAVAAPVGAGGAVGPRKPQQTSARPGMLKLGIVEPGEGLLTIGHRLSFGGENERIIFI